MPEGPEVKTVAQTLNQSLMGKILGELWLGNKSLRTAFNASELKKLENKSIEKIVSHGKVLFFYSNKNPIIVAQLGMTGQLKVESQNKNVEPHTHVRWKIKNSLFEIRYVDPRRFGRFDFCDEAEYLKIIKGLGPDPFNITKEQTELVIRKFKKSHRAIKEVLLDQKIITGVGNIYASEALFLAKINPTKKACEISNPQYEKLISSIIEVLNLGFLNGGTTFSDYVDGNGNKGQNIANLKVFKREGLVCFICGNKLLRIKQGGRSTFYCNNCQAN